MMNIANWDMTNPRLATLRILAQMTLLIPTGEILIKKGNNETFLSANFVKRRMQNVDLPHDSINHLHDDFIYDLEKLNDRTATFTQRSKYSTKGQTKEYYPQSVGSRTVSYDFFIFDIFRMSLKKRAFFKEWIQVHLDYCAIESMHLRSGKRLGTSCLGTGYVPNPRNCPQCPLCAQQYFRLRVWIWSQDFQDEWSRPLPIQDKLRSKKSPESK